MTSLAWSPDGKLLAAGSYGGEVRLAEPRSGKVWLLSGNDCDATRIGEPEETLVAFHPKDPKLVGASPSGRTFVWELSSRSVRGQIPTKGPLTALEFSPDGRLLITTGVHDITVWQWPELKQLSKRGLRTESQRHANPMIRLAVREDSVAVTAADQFQVLSLPGLESIVAPRPSGGHGLAYDGRNWLVAGSNGVPECDHLAEGGRWLAASTSCAPVEILDRQSGRKFSLESQVQPIYDLSFSRNTLALATADGVTIWPMDSERPPKTLAANGRWGIFPKLSPQADRLAVADTQYLWVYEIGSGNLLGKQELGSMLEAADLRWSPNGEHLQVPLRKSRFSSFRKEPRLLEVDLKPWKVRTAPCSLPAEWHVPTEALGFGGATRFVPMEDGSVHLVDADTGALEGTLLLYNHGWLYFQLDGRYDGSPAEVQARFVRQGRVHSLKQLPPPTPGLFLRAARGDSPPSGPIWEPASELEL